MTEENLPDLPESITHRAHNGSLTGFYTSDQMREYARAAVAKEREACAMVCDEQYKIFSSYEYAGGPMNALGERFASRECAKEIRARAAS